MIKRTHPLLWAAALLCFSVLLYFWGLGRMPFYTKGEPREAVQVWEEVHNGEWVLPLRDGFDLPSKPPLFHWLAGLAALAIGEVNEFSVRFPSALLATLSVLLVFWLGATKWGTAAGVYAGFMLATNFEWMRAATTARVDMTLTAFLVGALVALDRVVSAPRPTVGSLVAFYLCVGLATLGKGPVGIVLAALVAVIYLALRGDLARLRQMHLLPGAALALLIAGSWYVLAILQGGSAFLYKQLWVENFGRFFAAESSGAGHQHPFYYMIGALFTGFAPWSAFVIPLGFFLYAKRQRLEALGYLYPLVWFGVVFLFYSISASKRTVYLLPVYPAVALLLGAWWQQLAEDERSVPPLVVESLRVISLVVTGVVVAALGVILATGLGLEPLVWLKPLLHPKDQENLPLLEELVRARLAIFLAWTAALAPIILLFASGVRWRNWALVFASLVAFVAGAEGVVDGVFQPLVAEQRSFKPFMESVRGVVGDEDRLAFYRAFDYGAVFYARRHIEPLDDEFVDPPSADQRSYLLLWQSEWDKLTDEQRARLELLLKSDGTGPKGRDPLVFALVKPDAGAPAEESVGVDSPGVDSPSPGLSPKGRGE